MPFVGLGLHFLVAIYFAIHAVRTGQQTYWLLILFSFPLLGSVVYFATIYLPASKLERGIMKMANVASKAMDPGRELREAKQAFDLTPTAQNQMRLANALLESGDTAQAVQQFDLCLKGPFASDAAIRFGAARAKLQNGQTDNAIELLLRIKTETPDFKPEQLSLELAHAFGAANRNDEARREFVSAVARFDSVDARAEFAIWAAESGDIRTANELRTELDKAQKHWGKHTRTLHQPIIRRVDAAILAANVATQK